ncbi:LysM peptidoglycan-binding domain-containing protein [uncultured Sulfitobacter sp.]|uniref:LysM peptidoglycan-binding domain-containing protein n=1 Tax=uncultured Sulfitobacter sp. TaxID=191468 RepID=UPI002621649B|nr:LysM peptidoglycan-binding domain-containing protein [uncultured Sulfitobacter sp.]
MFHIRGLIAGLSIAIAPFAGSAQGDTITCGKDYTVARGDTLSKISIQAYGISAFGVLVEANKDALAANPNLLFVGQKLMVPCRDTAAQAEVVPATAQSTAPAADPQGPVVLTFNKVSDPRFVINAAIIDPFLEQIEMATEGRVKFVAPEEMNRSAIDQLELVKTGQIDATYVLNSYLAKSHPLLALPMIPLMGGSAEQTAVSLWNLHERYLAETGYFDDAHVLGFIAAPTAHIWHSINDPVVAGENILNRNNYPVPYFEGLDTIGPKRVQQQNAAIYGTHDEASDGPLTFMMAHGAARGGGIWNPTRAVTEVENGIYTPTFTVIVSNEAWARISPADQETINTLSGVNLSKRSAAWDDFDNSHRQIMKDTGLLVNYPDGPLLREIEESTQTKLAIWAEAATALSIPAQQAIASYRADLASLRYLLIFR